MVAASGPYWLPSSAVATKVDREDAVRFTTLLPTKMVEMVRS